MRRQRSRAASRLLSGAVIVIAVQQLPTTLADCKYWFSDQGVEFDL